MDMNMEMPTSTMAQSATASPMSSTGGMSGMASTFSFNTRVTLFFADWTTTTPGEYFGTIVFLFFLGILNRFFGALKSQLERRWKATDALHGPERRNSSLPRGHFRKWSRALGSQNLQSKDEEAIEPLSPAPVLPINDEKHTKNNGQRFWIPSAPWSVKKDSIRAILEFIRALIGYILMLAVMTYNVGFLFAVTGSVLLGELVFGRYTQGLSGWQEGGCHE